MLRYLLSHRSRPGTRPGTLTDTPEHLRIGRLTAYRMDFGGDDAVDETCEHSVDAVLAGPGAPAHRLRWLHFEGDIDASGLSRLGETFGLHALALEDVLNHGQRPKLDVYADNLFIAMALPVDSDDSLRFEQVSLFIGRDFVLSFHAGDRDIFAPIRQRVHAARGRIVHAETDYLAYCLADLVVDTGFTVLARFNDQLDALEDDIFEYATRDLVGAIHHLRRQLIALRKVWHGQNELLLRWTSLDHELVHEDNRPYFRDAQDHARRVSDLVDGYYDTTGSLLDTHLSLASNRLNDVMRMLTLIATIFMPLSFIAGLYGMNFDTGSPWNMPELAWRFGYPTVLLLMTLIVIVMIAYFRRRRWL